jgi:hypothetical protein
VGELIVVRNLPLKLKSAYFILGRHMSRHPLEGCTAKCTDFGAIRGNVPICLWDMSTNIAKQVLRRDLHHTKKSTMVTYSVTCFGPENDIERVISDLTLRLKIQALPCPTLQVGQDRLHGIVNHGRRLLRCVDHGLGRKITDHVHIG